MMNQTVLSVLQSPDDGTPLSRDLVSQSGIEYRVSDGGVLLLDHGRRKPLDAVYEHPMMVKWEGILQERLLYYTKKRTLAGGAASFSISGNSSHRRVSMSRS